MPSEGGIATLEILKLIAQVATPIAVVIVGLLLRDIGNRIDQKQWLNRQLIEARIEKYDLIAPLINAIYCYGCYIGDWKDLSPIAILEKKRALDREFAVAKFLFSEPISDAYAQFSQTCFLMFSERGKDAKSRANVNNHREAWADKWKPEWDQFFVDPANRAKRKDVEQTYLTLMRALAGDLSLELRSNAARR